MKIGITERGDAGRDLSWYGKLSDGGYDGAILITKVADEEFIRQVLALYQVFPHLIVHGTCTGWGGTWLEPNVPPTSEQIWSLARLTSNGFPVTNLVLRVDPIIPTEEGIRRAEIALSMAGQIRGLSRVRISVLDEYRHVKDRLVSAGHSPFYGKSFQAGWQMKRVVMNMLKRWPGMRFETCAEDWLARCRGLGNVDCCGCVSVKDLSLMGLNLDRVYGENGQGRHGCHCLSCKTELLNRKERCPNQCLYCYWQD